MADHYTSLVGLVLAEPVQDVAAVVQAAIDAGDIDRRDAVGDGSQAQQVNWGGRMAKAVIRALADDRGRPVLRTETYVGGDGMVAGMTRQAQLVQALARVMGSQVTAVVDLSARVEHDLAWLNRMAIGAVEQDDAITVHDTGQGTHWVFTHGAGRLDIPDLELYGLSRSQIDGARQALVHVHGQLLDTGLTASLALPDGTDVYLVPVLQAWQHVSLDWPGVGRAGVDRGPGLDGPRATLSVLHPPRFGRYRKDLKGVLAHL